MFTDRHVFLIATTDGTDIYVVNGYGETREEAQSYLSLNDAWHVVNDSAVIKSFIEEIMDEEKPDNLSPNLQKQWDEFMEGLKELESIQNSKEEVKMTMTIEEKMAYIRKALEMGASVDLSLHAFKGKEEAAAAAEELSKIIHIDHDHKSFKGSNWYKIKSEDYSLNTSVFYDDDVYMEEDIWATEDEEHVS